MNTELIKKALIFTAGVGVGVIVGAILIKKRYDRLYFTPTETFVYKDIEREAIEQNEAAVEETVYARETSTEIDNIAKTIKEKNRGLRRNYNNIIEESRYGVVGVNVPNQDKDNYECELASRKANSHDSNEDPYVITIDQFADENDHYDKSTIYYYEDDDVLADENEEVIIDVFKVIGDDALGSFGEGSRDPEIVYVRNDKLQIDYEVIRLSKSYRQTVLGYMEE
jgi:hypothetical protein